MSTPALATAEVAVSSGWLPRPVGCGTPVFPRFSRGDPARGTGDVDEAAADTTSGEGVESDERVVSRVGAVGAVAAEATASVVAPPVAGFRVPAAAVSASGFSDAAVSASGLSTDGLSTGAFPTGGLSFGVFAAAVVAEAALRRAGVVLLVLLFALPRGVVLALLRLAPPRAALPALTVVDRPVGALPVLPDVDRAVGVLEPRAFVPLPVPVPLPLPVRLPLAPALELRRAALLLRLEDASGVALLLLLLVVRRVAAAVAAADAVGVLRVVFGESARGEAVRRADGVAAVLSAVALVVFATGDSLVDAGVRAAVAAKGFLSDTKAVDDVVALAALAAAVGEGAAPTRAFVAEAGSCAPGDLSARVIGVAAVGVLANAATFAGNLPGVAAAVVVAGAAATFAGDLSGAAAVSVVAAAAAIACVGEPVLGSAEEDVRRRARPAATCPLNAAVLLGDSASSRFRLRGCTKTPWACGHLK